MDERVTDAVPWGARGQLNSTCRCEIEVKKVPGTGNLVIVSFAYTASYSAQ